MATRKADREIEPWMTLDWSKNGPYGVAQTIPKPLPCRVCGLDSYLLSPEKKTPMHKVCAEQWLLCRELLPILALLGS